MDHDVIVIGAGAAGLIAARELSRAGRSVALLEARARLGGRIYQVSDARALAPIELGAEFVHGRPAITYGLLHEIGTTVIDDAENSFSVRNGSLEPAESDPFEAAGSLLARALERAEDESVEDLILRYARNGAENEAGEWTRRFVAGFDAADPARASARALAREWTGDASAEGAQSRPLGGYAPLIAHLADSLDPERVDLRLETVVTNLTRDARGVSVTAQSSNAATTLRARRAVIAIPHGVLAARPGEEGAIVFEPDLPAATREAIGCIATGPVVRVVLVFREPFWESLRNGKWRDGAFFHGDGAFPTLWTQLPVRANTLVAWAGGPFAARLQGTDAAARRELALACAGRYFGDERAARNAFACAYHHDWQSDPYARGAYTYVLTGGECARADLANPVDGKIWFAGEATADGAEGGTVAGALESGLRAASELVAER